MAASVRLCDICEARDITVFATDWCPECEQGLCESCKSYHSASKLSKTHETIPFESFDKLPAAVKETKNDCSEHEARFEYYCSQHEVPCCVECMKITHAECRHLTPMHKVVEHFKTSNALSDFEQTLSDLNNNLNSLIKDRFDNLSLLAKEKNKCLKEIADTKRKVIAHLDQLETKLKTEIDVLHREHLQAIEETIKEFEDSKAKVSKIQEETDVIKQYASDFQLFITFTELENRVKNVEKNVHSVIKFSAKQISLSFSPEVEPAIETLLPSLGIVNVIAKESDIKLVNSREKQAQILAIETPCVDKIKLKPLFKYIQLPRGNDDKLVIKNSCFLSDGRLAFSDKLNYRLILVKDNGDHDSDIQLSFMPNCIAYITDKETAVGKCKSNEINIINMTNASVNRSFALKGYGTCVFSFKNGKFLVTGSRIGFCITDIEGIILSEIPYNHDSNILFAVLLNDKIYFSEWEKDRIVCCDLKGNTIYQFEDKNLKAPVGVACNDANVLFITGFRSKNIYALSSTGNKLKELYCNSNMSNPRGISYNSSNQQLLVSTENGKVFLFDVVY